MRALLVCSTAVLALLAVPPQASAQMKLSPKATAPGGTETRYFTAMDGLMDGNADVILKETRQGKTLSAAVLDVCYPIAKNSDRKDRFVVNLQVAGQTLTGTTQSISEKSPVSVKLTRKQSGDMFEFRGQIAVGQAVTEVTSPDNSDLSEKEFLDSQTSDDGITPQPKDFTDVSPEAIAVKVKLDAATDFLKSLKGQEVEVTLASLNVGCDALRAGEQTITMSVDPERAGALLAKFKAMPGVTAAGWTAGMTEMDRTIRFPAADWREGDKINKGKLATAVASVLSRTLAAKPVTQNFNPATGRLKLVFKRPNQDFPALELTDTIEVAGLVSPDKPGTTDKLMLWIGSPATTTADEGSGARLNLSDDASLDEEGDLPDDNGSIEALVKELKGQRWDADKSVWK
ncbi:hypothetical protein I6F14_20340 [Bradyrhizobium sp. IC3069]|uniref:Uncharacterized protein n=1 Tax=Bradyrhizobium yuanmingense TaxID=108015 RepID=A0A0R3CMX7_9BRAD|nr:MULTISPECIES: hypothetical protein [Bradyrhizobium]KRP96387.1 hypothetical protein AOQ72_18950 [Bradyrhizobium yuanmingense]MCA1363248.1 hypothetical protein [Bradyrhizobium sp. IC4059]MCA1390505.1 hypothetical protein [Bradyrhizobium sp. IC3123]MCA1520334.1 hypothetical protein [Bradyrhizobium sp. IC3069]TGN84238.1 hypothetical protein EOW77_0022550 [Bradyrhizobium yuanmingense]